MARPSKSNETSRLNLEMAIGVRQRLEELREETNAGSLGEVIRRALTVYDFLLTEKTLGRKLFTKGDGETKEVVLI